VSFGYSTIQRWYYTVLKHPKAPLCALSKRRCDAGVPLALTQQACHRLARQAERHASWPYSRHRQVLVEHMNGRDWGPPPSYATVRRYLVSLGTTQNIAADAKIVRLEGLVAHLRSADCRIHSKQVAENPGASRHTVRTSVQALPTVPSAREGVYSFSSK
jgi:hypothetical protein